MLRSLLVFCLVCVGAPALAQEYQPRELADAARVWRQELIDSIPANNKQPRLVAGLRRTAEVDYQAKRYAAAIDELTRAIANGADDGLVWLWLAQNELAAEDDHAIVSAYNAYLKSTDPVERGAALFVIGRDYDRHDKQKEALAAFDASLGFTRLPAIADRAEELRRLVAFRVTKVEVQAEAEWGRTCLRFNEPIGIKGDISYSSYVRSEPKLEGIVTARGDTLCLDGMKHGGIYNIEVLAGLPAATGERTRETFTTRVVVPDRKPQIRFSGAGYVLPKQDTSGLPLTTINVDKVKLRLLRVNERNLVPSIDAERLTMSFSSYEVDEIVNRTGSLVWQGEMAIAGDRTVQWQRRSRSRICFTRKAPASTSPSPSAATQRRTNTPSRRRTGFSSPISASPLTKARTGWRSMSARSPTASRSRVSRSGFMPATTASLLRQPAMPRGRAHFRRNAARSRRRRAFRNHSAWRR
jgi:hypothetical protein